MLKRGSPRCLARAIARAGFAGLPRRRARRGDIVTENPAMRASGKTTLSRLFTPLDMKLSHGVNCPSLERMVTSVQRRYQRSPSLSKNLSIWRKRRACQLSFSGW